MRTNNRRRNKNRGRKGNPRSQNTRISNLTSISRVSGIAKTIVVRDWLRGDPLLLTVLNGATTFNGTAYVNFNSTQILATSSESRVNTYQDWRMLKIIAKIIPLAPGFTGSTSFGFSEDSNDAGDTSYALQGRCLVVANNGNNSSMRRLAWSAANFDDLSFKRTTLNPITPTPVIFNAYTDSANLGTTAPAANTMVFRVEFDLLCEMRGLTG